VTKDELKKWLEEAMKDFEERLKAVKLLEDMAKDAVKDGDADDLAVAQKGTRVQWKTRLPTQKEIDDNLKNFGQGDAGLKKLRDQLTAKIDEIDCIVTRVQRMTMRPRPKIDFKALARALKIDKCPNSADKLEKALKLQCDARKKALEALEKECKVRFPAKDMKTLIEN